MSPSPAIIGSVIALGIIFGGVITIARNYFIFLRETIIGHRGKTWYDRPYLFRTLAWLFTLLWLYGPYENVTTTQTTARMLAILAYIVAAANWLWVQRISFLDGIPQQELHLGPIWAQGLGWNGHALLTFFIQLLCAAAIGYLIITIGTNSLLSLLIIIPFLIGTAGMSLWRATCVTSENTIQERMQKFISGRDA